jgi:hypothetical protein
VKGSKLLEFRGLLRPLWIRRVLVRAQEGQCPPCTAVGVCFGARPAARAKRGNATRNNGGPGSSPGSLLHPYVVRRYWKSTSRAQEELFGHQARSGPHSRCRRLVRRGSVFTRRRRPYNCRSASSRKEGDRGVEGPQVRMKDGGRGEACPRRGVACWVLVTLQELRGLENVARCRRGVRRAVA